MFAANEHLKETMKDKDGNERPYYKQVNESKFEEANDKLLKLLQTGYDNEILTKQ